MAGKACCGGCPPKVGPTGPPGEQGDPGPPGPPGSGTPCVSTDAGNVATIGEDGCVFVPPGDTNMVGSPCVAVQGDGSGAAPFRPVAVVNPSACNGIQCTAAGLHMPETRVTGFVGPTPARINANFPSVDTYITAPAPSACPQTYQVKAFHTPPRGTVVLPADVDLRFTRPNATWANTGLVLRLPEPGAYLIVGSIRTNCCCNIPTSGAAIRTTNIWTRARLINSATGTNLMNGIGLAQHQFSIAAGDGGFQSCFSGTITWTGYVNAAAAMTVRVQAGLSGSVSGGSTIQSSIVGEGQLTFVKIAD